MKPRPKFIQCSCIEGNRIDLRRARAVIKHRPDIIIFVNGLPLILFELKNPADAEATTTNAFNQIETYKQQSV